MARSFSTKSLPLACDAIAPDGSEVRILLSLGRGGVAHFQLAPGQTSVAVAHKTIEEIWYFVQGRGTMWRSLDGHDEAVDVQPGVCVTIPVGTRFQFKSFGPDSLAAVGVSMPPWPGQGEAYFVEGPWVATVPAGEA
jgi:mannose-6-phosphate isomerase-like protein (cupin superfamily)